MILGIIAGQRSLAQIIKGLFAQGQQGFWLPFTDFASLSQDSAGTLPYTALEQPVGRVLDRSGRGNHATQPTSTARGAVSARVNWLVKSEDFADASWFKGWASFAGTRLTEDASNNAAHFIQQNSAAFAANSTISFKARLSNAGRGWALLWDGTNNRRAWFNLASGVVGATLGGATSTITHVGDGVYDCEMVFTNPTAALNLRVALAPSNGLAYYDGDGVSAINIFRTSITTSAQSTLPYQRVNTSTDYDAVGFPKYLRLDGVDDFYTCGGGGSTTGFYYSDVIRPSGAGLRAFFSDRNFGAKGFEAAVNAANKVILIGGNGSAYSGPTSTDSVPNGALTHVAVWDDQTNLCIQINGGAVITAARPAIVGGRSTVNLGKALEDANYFNGQITEPIYRAGPPPSAYERGVIRAYQMKKAGML